MTSLPRQSSLGYQINHLARLLGNGLRVNIADTGVTPGQFAQLPALFEEDGLTQQELCERVRIDQSTMAHTLKRMQRDGLVVRTADPQDRRRSHYRLTERARQIQHGHVHRLGELVAQPQEQRPHQAAQVHRLVEPEGRGQHLAAEEVRPAGLRLRGEPPVLQGPQQPVNELLGRPSLVASSSSVTPLPCLPISCKISSARSTLPTGDCPSATTLASPFRFMEG
ncbi:MarR family winged helix-turn-helix transcriptional regulator [Nonomuraea angiospora]|uniref:MarR family winged helix-turn-helix transcriptional regulator n=1 Tax=Nonomuraea angiospora TaxID=46172 RepID=UPI003F53EF35